MTRGQALERCSSEPSHPFPSLRAQDCPGMVSKPRHPHPQASMAPHPLALEIRSMAVQSSPRAGTSFMVPVAGVFCPARGSFMPVPRLQWGREGPVSKSFFSRRYLQVPPRVQLGAAWGCGGRFMSWQEAKPLSQQRALAHSLFPPDAQVTWDATERKDLKKKKKKPDWGRGQKAPTPGLLSDSACQLVTPGCELEGSLAVTLNIFFF